uniref:IDEAL domain-containing protein n=1 Tax=Meloidogyne hapla TaxID=6305 RepID=A0A1I8BR83_MELHA
MPIIFKQHQRLKTQRHKPVRSLRGKTGRRLLHAAPTAIRRLSVRLTDGRQFRAGMHGIRALRRHSIRAGRSIYRIKETGTSLHKYLRVSIINDEYEKERSFFVKRMEELVVDLVARDPNKRQEFMEEAIDHLSWRLSYELASKKSEWSILTSM